MEMPTRILRFCCLAALVCILPQEAIFASGLYRRMLNPDSIGGQASFTIQFEKKRPGSGNREVVLLGDSGMQFGFWPGLFDRSHPGYRAVMATVPTANAAWFHYMLAQLDPHRDRYAGIVIGVRGYKIFPRHEDDANRFESAQVWAPQLESQDYDDLLSTMTDSRIKARAAILHQLPARAYSLDFQDLVCHPLRRLIHLVQRYDDPDPLQDYAGDLHTVGDLHIGPGGHIDRYPSWYITSQKKEADQLVARPSPAEARHFTDLRSQFDRFWINRIVAAYRNSPTKLIFVAYPRYPSPITSYVPMANAPDLRALVQSSPNLHWVDENAFTDLENGSNFYDLLHLNGAGRRIFTARLGRQITDILGNSATNR
jgi:hypothetical protein